MKRDNRQGRKEGAGEMKARNGRGGMKRREGGEGMIRRGGGGGGLILREGRK